MNKINVRDFGIYVHYPFCTRKCEYCDFLSFPKERKKSRAYEVALLEEIQERKKELEDLAREGKGVSLFFGGGTPSLMSLDTLTQVMEGFRPYLHLSSEISIEINPGTCDREKLKAYKELGVNRLSFGLQSIHNDELALLGRIHQFETFDRQFKIAREVGFTNINVDLMMALPKQSIDKYIESLRQLIKYKPEHISAYSLIIEEGTPFYDSYALEDEKRAKGGLPRLLPTEEVERQMYTQGRSILRQNGYLAYEISNYAREGFECIHNLGYWQLRPYIGFGLGAASYYPDKHQRVTQNKDLTSYLDGERKPSIESLEISEEMEEYIFLPLRTYKGIDISVFEDKFGVCFEPIFGEVIQKLVQDGYGIYEPNQWFRFSEKGMDVGDYLTLKLLDCIH